MKQTRKRKFGSTKGKSVCSAGDEKGVAGVYKLHRLPHPLVSYLLFCQFSVLTSMNYSEIECHSGGLKEAGQLYLSFSDMESQENFLVLHSCSKVEYLLYLLKMTPLPFPSAFPSRTSC